MNYRAKCNRIIAFLIGLIAIGAEHAAYAAKSKPGSLDGATVYTIENFRQVGNSQASVAYGLYPMDAFFTSFDIGAAYSYFFTDNMGWEVLRFSYFFNSQTDVTQQLADKFSVNPQKIDTPKNSLSSSFLYTLSYGKQLFLNRYFFYNRYIAILGIGQLNSEQQSSYMGVLGLRGDFAVDESFSWTIDARYNVSFNAKQDNQFGVLFGTGYNF